MAYYVTNIGSNAGNTTQVTFTGSIPSDAKTGDFLLLCVTAQNFLTDIVVNTAGWTKLGQPVNGSGSNAIFWKIFDGSEETVEVTSTGGVGQRWGTVVSVYRDVDQTSPIVDHGGSVDVGDSVTCASLTPTNEDDLFVTSMVGNTSLEYKPLVQSSVPYPYELMANAGYRWTRTIVLFLSSGLYNTQATGSSFVLGHNSTDPSAYSIILKNSSGGQTVAPMAIDYSLNRVFGDYCVDSAEEANDTWVDGSGIVSAIDGGAVVTESNQSNTGSTAQYSNNENPTSVCNSTSFTPTSTIQGEWSVWYQSITEDLTGKILLLEGSESNANRADEVGIILLDSSDNWSVYTLKIGVRGDANPVAGGGITLAISENTVPRYSSATPCDVTGITKIGTVSRASSNISDGHLIHSIKIISSVTLVGGTSSNPITSQGLRNLSGAGYLRGLVNAQGLGQVLARVPIRIGDGTTSTYYDGSDRSLEFASPDGVWFQHDLSDLSLSIELGATDTYTATTISASEGGVNYDLSASSVSATYDFSNTTISGMTPTLNASIAIDNQKFSNCGLITGGGGTYTNLKIQGSSSTTSAMTISSSADLTGSSFTKGAETYAIELTEAGSYDLSDCTFTGYTTDINVSATTGTVTITLGRGQAEPSYTTAGATIVFVIPQSTVSITGIVAGSRLQIYNVTTAAEVANEIVAGTSYSASYDEGTGYNDGDTVRVRLTCQSGVTACNEFQQSTVVSASGWNILADQTTDTVYGTIGIDGSTITKFAADYVNDQIDLIVASNFALAEWYAWWVYNLTTEQGIRNFYGAVEALDEGNFFNDNTILSIKWDNHTVSNVYQTDTRRFYRADDAYPVFDPTTGGGGIDIVWRSQVLVVTLGQVSGVGGGGGASSALSINLGSAGKTVTATVYDKAGVVQNSPVALTDYGNGVYSGAFTTSSLADGEYHVDFDDTDGENVGVGTIFIRNGVEVTQNNSFNATLDVVANVDTVSELTTNNDKTGYSISGTKTTLDDLNDFDPTTEEVNANIVKVNNLSVDGTGTEDDPWGPSS